MLQVSLSLDLVNAVLTYLGNRPFVEVASMIQGIHTEVVPQLPVEPAPEATPESGAQNV